MLCSEDVVPPTAIFFFFFNDTATTEIYTLSLHDALPISPNFKGRWTRRCRRLLAWRPGWVTWNGRTLASPVFLDRKSTRLNSSHLVISYAVFCLKKKNST